MMGKDLQEIGFNGKVVGLELREIEGETDWIAVLNLAGYFTEMPHQNYRIGCGFRVTGEQANKLFNEFYALMRNK